MPGYETHSRRALQVGTLSALAVGVAAFWTTRTVGIAVVAAVLTFAGARVGGNAPDIDSQSSIPHRYFTRSLQVLTIAGVVGGAFLFSGEIVRVAGEFTADLAPAIPAEAAGAGGVALVGALAVVLVPKVVAALMPSHRGILHNPLLWIGIGAGLSLAVGGLLSVAGIAAVVAAWVDSRNRSPAQVTGS